MFNKTVMVIAVVAVTARRAALFPGAEEELRTRPQLYIH